MATLPPGCPLEYHGIIAGPAEGNGDLAPRIGFGIDPGLWRFSIDAVTARPMNLQVRDASSGENDTVLRGQRIGLEWVVFDEKIGPQSFSAKIGFEDFLGDVFNDRVLRVDIDSNQSIEESIHCKSLKTLPFYRNRGTFFKDENGRSRSWSFSILSS
jgi:hypothetical protein